MVTTKTYGYSETKESLLKRLSRAEGQVRGVSRMVAQDTYCMEILTQINAVQSALDKVAVELLREHTKHCLRNDATDEDAYNKRADELVGAVNRLLSR